ncbi:MAG TPA: hypothetical protein VF585_00155 [Chthoniobacterales bacterium]|jgi:hypothetical protein
MSTKRRLVRIAPLQLGKMLGALYGAMGLIFIPFFGIFALIGAFLPKGANQPEFSGAMFAGAGVAMMILMPLLYAVMGFIIGIVGAAIYNLFSKWIGGIEVEVE